MKATIITIMSGVLTVVTLFTSGVLARQPESDEAVWKRFSENLKIQVEEMANDPAEMKEYILSREDVWLDHYRNGNTLLHYAANRGYLDIVTLLLKKGADINARDKDGRTPLHEAMAYRRYDVARFLVENGADMTLKNKNGETPLISIVFMDNRKLAVDLVRFFIEKGFNISRSADAKLLNESIRRGHHDVAVILLEKGIAFDDSSLGDAASMGYEDIFAVLLSRGADPGGKDILRAAAASGNVGILKTLLEKGQRPTAKDVDLALYRGRRDAAVLLNDALKRSGDGEVDLTARCRMKPDPGPCMALFRRGYCDGLTGTCRSFTYGGCGGTVPFDSEEACRRICEEPR